MPPSPQHVIALISGGKDSFLALLHCLAHNHHVVALANLHPVSPSITTDSNSYMYQTVGHTLIPLYARALHIPLYRGEILGPPVNPDRDYHPVHHDSRSSSSLAHPQDQADWLRQEDETESLLPLLRRVQLAHPSATALVSGAILSTYQRTRIESVALRLNLLPLAPLWQYPFLPTPKPRPAGLLDDIVAVGLKARIVKVASGGLDEGFLWADLGDERVKGAIKKGVDRFGGSVLGEGGEYETVVVDGPNGIWKGELVVEEGQRTVRKGKGGEAWIGFSGGEVVDKERGETGGDGAWRERLRIPEMWDDEFETLRRRIEIWDEELEGHVESNNIIRSERSEWSVEEATTKTLSTLKLSNMVVPTGKTASLQMAAITARLRTILDAHHRAPSDIVFTTILLRTMTDFDSVNASYATLFTTPNPPARVTVACGDLLPRGVMVMASFAVDLGSRLKRDGLHVQSRSYWAPANIGPYSQAIAVPIRGKQEEGEEAEEAAAVYVAGQIPLVPVTMEVVGHEANEGLGDVFRTQTCLALQHLWRIGKVMGVSWWMGGVAFITGADVHDVRKKASAAWLAWKVVHEHDFAEKEGAQQEEDGLDAWDRKYGGKGGGFVFKKNENRLPDFERIKGNESEGLLRKYTTGFLAAQVDELPRGCEVEWQALGTKKGFGKVESASIGGFPARMSNIVGSNRTVACIEFPISNFNQALGTEISSILDAAKRSVLGPNGRKMKVKIVEMIIYTSQTAEIGGVEAQIIPCRSVWGPQGTQLAAGIIINMEDEG